MKHDAGTSQHRHRAGSGPARNDHSASTDGTLELLRENQRSGKVGIFCPSPIIGCTTYCSCADGYRLARVEPRVWTVQ